VYPYLFLGFHCGPVSGVIIQAYLVDELLHGAMFIRGCQSMELSFVKGLTLLVSWLKIKSGPRDNTRKDFTGTTFDQEP
jgi:CHASE2 domain-containing sensor protein